MNRPNFVLSCLLFVIFTLYILRMYVVNQLAEADVALATYLEESRRLRRENAILKEEVLIRSSLTTISKKAQEMGFTSDEKVYFLRKAP